YRATASCRRTGSTSAWPGAAGRQPPAASASSSTATTPVARFRLSRIALPSVALRLPARQPLLTDIRNAGAESDSGSAAGGEGLAQAQLGDTGDVLLQAHLGLPAQLRAVGGANLAGGFDQEGEGLVEHARVGLRIG